MFFFTISKMPLTVPTKEQFKKSLEDALDSGDMSSPYVKAFKEACLEGHCGEYARDRVAEIEAMNDIMGKNKPDYDVFNVGKLDAHAWIEMPDGSIKDWYFQDYDNIKRLWNCEGRAYYYPNPEKFAPAMRHIIKKMVKTAKKFLPEVYTDAKAVFEDFYNEPKAGHCFMNAYAYKYFNPEVKLMVGSMGWASKKTGKIHWEFGDADMTWKAERVKAGYLPNNKPIDWSPDQKTLDVLNTAEAEMMGYPDGYMELYTDVQRFITKKDGNVYMRPETDEDFKKCMEFSAFMCKKQAEWNAPEVVKV